MTILSAFFYHCGMTKYKPLDELLNVRTNTLRLKKLNVFPSCHVFLGCNKLNPDSLLILYIGNYHHM